MSLTTLDESESSNDWEISDLDEILDEVRDKKKRMVQDRESKSE